MIKVKDRNFISFTQILEINNEIVSLTNEPHGLVNPSSLKFNLDEFIYNPYSQTNLYLFSKIIISLVNDHTFTEGNKRTGSIIFLIFLDFYNVKLNVNDDEIEKMIISIAKGEFNPELLEKYIQSIIG